MSSRIDKKIAAEILFCMGYPLEIVGGGMLYVLDRIRNWLCDVCSLALDLLIKRGRK